MLIFACNQPNNYGYLPCKAKMFSFKIYDNGKLVRDFVACYKKSNGEVGMFDILHKVFYGNKGSGVFSKGEEIVTPMSFRIQDKVIPMVYGADGKDQPMSKIGVSEPKVFEVVGSKIFYDGAVWQTITIQEA
jgi:hypothetical protein